MTSKVANQIGKRILRYRKKADLTQAGLALKAGLNTNTVAKVERGVNEATTETLKKLAKALGVSVTDLLGA